MNEMDVPQQMEVENKKIIIPSPVLFYESLVSVKENTDKKFKKKKRGKKKKQQTN